MNLRRIAAVGLAAGAIAVVSACDSATTANHNWVITPDVELHRQTGKPLITGTGQCGGFADGITRIRRSVEVNVWSISQGRTLIVDCSPGIPVGSWGIEERAL